MPRAFQGTRPKRRPAPASRGKEQGVGGVFQVEEAVRVQVVVEKLKAELGPVRTPGVPARGIEVKAVGQQKEGGHKGHDPEGPVGQGARGEEQERSGRPREDQDGLRPHLAGQGKKGCAEKQVPEGPSAKGDEETQDKGPREEGGRWLGRGRIEPLKVLGRQAKDERGCACGKPGARDHAPDEGRRAARIRRAAGCSGGRRRARSLPGAERRGSRETATRRAACCRRPSGAGTPRTRRCRSCSPGLIGQGHGLGHIGVDVLIEIDAVGARRHRRGEHEGEKGDRGQEGRFGAGGGFEKPASCPYGRPSAPAPEKRSWREGPRGFRPAADPESPPGEENRSRPRPRR